MNKPLIIGTMLSYGLARTIVMAVLAV